MFVNLSAPHTTYSKIPASGLLAIASGFIFSVSGQSMPFMKSFIAGLILMFGCSSLMAQQSPVDSLEALLAKAEPGYDQIDYLVGISRYHLFDYDEKKMLAVLAEAERIARETESWSGLAYVTVMRNMAAYGIEGDVDKAFRLMEEARTYAELSGDPDALAFVDYNDAENYLFEKNDFTTSLRIIQQSLDRIDERVTRKNVGNTYKCLGNIYGRSGRYNLALEAFRKALAQFKIVADNPDEHHLLGRVSAMYADGGVANIGQVLVHIGDTYRQIGNLTLADSTLREAVDVYVQARDTGSIAWTYGSLTDLHIQWGTLDQAIAYAREAIRFWESQPNAEREIAEAYMDLGNIYTLLKDYDEANRVFAIPTSYYRDRRDTLGLAGSLIQWNYALLGDRKMALVKHNLSEIKILNRRLRAIDLELSFLDQSSQVSLLEEDLLAAKQYLTRLSSLADSLNNSTMGFQAAYDLAEVYLLENQEGKALESADAALRMAILSGNRSYRSSSMEQRSRVFEQLGDLENALSSHRRYVAIKDSLATLEGQRILREEQVRQNINTYKAQKEAADREAQLMATRNRLYLLLTLLLGLVIAAISYLFLQLRKTKRQLEEQNEQLAQLNRTKDRFFGIIAHDIRSPIIALRGVGEQMAFYLEKGRTKKLHKLSQKLDVTGKRLSDLLDNLLNWALLQQGDIAHQPDTLQVHPIVSETIHMFDMSAETKGISIQNHIPKGLTVIADEHALNTILRNLISNAIKFTATGGSVRVSAETRDGQVLLRVQDTGIGMPPDKIQELFTLQSKSNKGTAGERGTGLGLILVKELAERQQGRLLVESHEQEGSIFTVALPKAA
jgi:signal transduction histidine kinase